MISRCGSAGPGGVTAARADRFPPVSGEQCSTARHCLPCALAPWGTTHAAAVVQQLLWLKVYSLECLIYWKFSTFSHIAPSVKEEKQKKQNRIPHEEAHTHKKKNDAFSPFFVTRWAARRFSAMFGLNSTNFPSISTKFRTTRKSSQSQFSNDEIR